MMNKTLFTAMCLSLAVPLTWCRKWPVFNELLKTLSRNELYPTSQELLKLNSPSFLAKSFDNVLG